MCSRVCVSVFPSTVVLPRFDGCRRFLKVDNFRLSWLHVDLVSNGIQRHRKNKLCTLSSCSHKLSEHNFKVSEVNCPRSNKLNRFANVLSTYFCVCRHSLCCVSSHLGFWGSYWANVPSGTVQTLAHRTPKVEVKVGSWQLTDTNESVVVPIVVKLSWNRMRWVSNYSKQVWHSVSDACEYC